MSRHVAHAFSQFRDKDRHYLMILRTLGFKSTTLHYERTDREIGASGHRFSKLVAHALSGTIFSSTRALHGVVGSGVVGTLGLLLAAYFVWMALFRTAPPGYTSIAVLLLMIGVSLMVSVGIVGVYVGKTFEQVRGRPLWIVERTIDRGVEFRPADSDREQPHVVD